MHLSSMESYFGRVDYSFVSGLVAKIWHHFEFPHFGSPARFSFLFLILPSQMDASIVLMVVWFQSASKGRSSNGPTAPKHCMSLLWAIRLLKRMSGLCRSEPTQRAFRLSRLMSFPR